MVKQDINEQEHAEEVSGISEESAARVQADVLEKTKVPRQ